MEVKKIEKQLKLFNLTYDEVFLLLSMSNNQNIKNTLGSLIDKKFLIRIGDEIVINQTEVDNIAHILELFKANNITDNHSIDLPKLADDMQLLFPEGKKAGTKFYWRGNKPEIIKKLESFYTKYGFFEPEAILEATKNYINAYQNDMRFMQLLKYFISKKKNVGGELEEMSELMTYLENLNTPEDTNSQDWTVNTVN